MDVRWVSIIESLFFFFFFFFFPPPPPSNDAPLTDLRLLTVRLLVHSSDTKVGTFYSRILIAEGKKDVVESWPCVLKAYGASARLRDQFSR